MDIFWNGTFTLIYSEDIISSDSVKVCKPCKIWKETIRTKGIDLPHEFQSQSFWNEHIQSPSGYTYRYDEPKLIIISSLSTLHPE